MCGRYVQVASPELLAERFQVDEVAAPPEPADYNVAPRKHVVAIREREPHHRVLERLRWGLIPAWAKDAKIGDRLINARADSVAEKPAYRRAFTKRRCILPADGFYEWQVVPGQKRKQPMFIHGRDGEPLAFAGLWETWRDPNLEDAPWVVTCVIITTDANATLEPIHDRMPVVLPESAWDTWLDPDQHDAEVLGRLLVPAADDVLEAYAVDPLVNSTRNNGPDLVRPATPDTLFP